MNKYKNVCTSSWDHNDGFCAVILKDMLFILFNLSKCGRCEVKNGGFDTCEGDTLTSSITSAIYCRSSEQARSEGVTQWEDSTQGLVDQVLDTDGLLVLSRAAASNVILFISRQRSDAVPTVFGLIAVR